MPGTPNPTRPLIVLIGPYHRLFHLHAVKLRHIGGMLPGLKLRQMTWSLSVGPAEYPSFARCTRLLDGLGKGFD